MHRRPASQRDDGRGSGPPTEKSRIQGESAASRHSAVSANNANLLRRFWGAGRLFMIRAGEIVEPVPERDVEIPVGGRWVGEPYLHFSRCDFLIRIEVCERVALCRAAAKPERRDAQA